MSDEQPKQLKLTPKEEKANKWVMILILLLTVVISLIFLLRGGGGMFGPKIYQF